MLTGDDVSRPLAEERAEEWRRQLESSPRERAASTAKQGSASAKQTAMAEMIQALDTDGDGRVEVGEVMSTLKVSKKQAQKLLREFGGAKGQVRDTPWQTPHSSAHIAWSLNCWVCRG